MKESWSEKRRLLRGWGRAVLSVLYPPRCVACERASEYAPGQTKDELMCEGFCEICRAQVFELEAMCAVSCRICGHPMAPETSHSPQALCVACRLSPPLFRRAYAIFVYEGGIRDALHRFKYDGRLHAGRILCELFAASASQLSIPWDTYDYATPVPLHPKRLRERGFQQAWVLLHALPLSPRICKHPTLLTRAKHTETQAGLVKQARLANLKDAIQVRPQHRRNLAHTRILLVDDVLTTGATANACAAVLRNAGAKSVDVLTLCRAVY